MGGVPNEHTVDRLLASIAYCLIMIIQDLCCDIEMAHDFSNHKVLFVT